MDLMYDIDFDKYKRRVKNDPMENFDKELFIEGCVDWFYKKSILLIADAVKRNELIVECNLYEMINLKELRKIAAVPCTFSILDDYRDEILERTQLRLKKAGFQTTSTYRVNPYMVATYTVGCDDMSQTDLDRLGRQFTQEMDARLVMAAVLGLTVLILLYNAVIMIFKYRDDMPKLPDVFYTMIPQMVASCFTVAFAVFGVFYYFRRLIVAYFVKQKVIWRNMTLNMRKTSKKENNSDGAENNTNAEDNAIKSDDIVGEQDSEIGDNNEIESEEHA